MVVFHRARFYMRPFTAPEWLNTEVIAKLITSVQRKRAPFQIINAIKCFHSNVNHKEKFILIEPPVVMHNSCWCSRIFSACKINFSANQLSGVYWQGMCVQGSHGATNGRSCGPISIDTRRELEIRTQLNHYYKDHTSISLSGKGRIRLYFMDG